MMKRVGILFVLTFTTSLCLERLDARKHHHHHHHKNKITKPIAKKSKNLLTSIIGRWEEQMADLQELGVTFKHHKLQMGEQISVKAAKHEPRLTIPRKNSVGDPVCEVGKFYTLMMIDPDASSPHWRHWLVTDIPGAACKVSEGDVVTPYAPPTPPLGTGNHHYMLLLLEQEEKGLPDRPRSGGKSGARGNWDTSDFIRNNHLQPVAYTYFTAHYGS